MNSFYKAITRTCSQFNRWISKWSKNG